MKNLLIFLMLFILIGIAGMFFKMNCDLEDYKKQVAFENFEKEKRLAEMEKDIRILKTDSYINTNGFEGEKE